MKEIEINVKGMVCGECEKRVINAVSSIEGVENVIANHETGKVDIVYKESVDVQSIKDKIEDIGFEVVED